MDKFNDFIQNCELLDIPAAGRKYTWYRPNGMAKSIIDRILVSEAWLQLWPESKQFIMSRSVSDHCVIVVKNSIVNCGLKPFRTLDVWQQTKGFKEVVRNSCMTPLRDGNIMVNLKLKLKWLETNLKIWNLEVFNKSKVRKK